jgi:hypothetical protein
MAVIAQALPGYEGYSQDHHLEVDQALTGDDLTPGA